jgi:hypothetical protein
VTELTPLKPDPVMMTWHPAGPLIGEKPLIDGAAAAGPASTPRSRRATRNVPPILTNVSRWGRFLLIIAPFSRSGTHPSASSVLQSGPPRNAQGY